MQNNQAIRLHGYILHVYHTNQSNFYIVDIGSSDNTIEIDTYNKEGIRLAKFIIRFKNKKLLYEYLWGM